MPFKFSLSDVGKGQIFSHQSNGRAVAYTSKAIKCSRNVFISFLRNEKGYNRKKIRESGQKNGGRQEKYNTRCFKGHYWLFWYCEIFEVVFRAPSCLSVASRDSIRTGQT